MFSWSLCTQNSCTTGIFAGNWNQTYFRFWCSVFPSLLLYRVFCSKVQEWAKRFSWVSVLEYLLTYTSTKMTCPYADGGVISLFAILDKVFMHPCRSFSYHRKSSTKRASKVLAPFHRMHHSDQPLGWFALRFGEPSLISNRNKQIAMNRFT